MRVLIAGCGYVGRALGAELARQGHEVFGMRRSEAAEAELKAAGIRLVRGDITEPGGLAALPTPFDWVVNCVATAGGGAEDYRRVYVQGTRNLLDRLVNAPPRKLVYTSSTSVYGQTDGSLVDETSPAEPETETGRVLVEAEQKLLEAAKRTEFPAVILRVAAIYGPGRGHLFRQYLRNEARLEGKGERVQNMIHLDDVVGCIIAALEKGRAGEIYNAADDEPASQLGLFTWLAQTLGRPLPQSAPAGSIERKRGTTNKRVSNQKLKAQLGYRFKFPDFRSGLAVEIQRLAGTSGLKTV